MQDDPVELLSATEGEGPDVAAARHRIGQRLLYSVACDWHNASAREWLTGLCYAARDQLLESWLQTRRSEYATDQKRIYYMSMEFLIGRALTNSLLATGNYDTYREVLASHGHDLDEIATKEPDPALGN